MRENDRPIRECRLWWAGFCCLWANMWSKGKQGKIATQTHAENSADYGMFGHFQGELAAEIVAKVCWTGINKEKNKIVHRIVQNPIVMALTNIAGIFCKKPDKKHQKSINKFTIYLHISCKVILFHQKIRGRWFHWRENKETLDRGIRRLFCCVIGRRKKFTERKKGYSYEV